MNSLEKPNASRDILATRVSPPPTTSATLQQTKNATTTTTATKSKQFTTTIAEKRNLCSDLPLEARHTISLEIAKKRRLSVASSSCIFMPKGMGGNSVKGAAKRNKLLLKLQKSAKCKKPKLTHPQSFPIRRPSPISNEELRSVVDGLREIKSQTLTSNNSEEGTQTELWQDIEQTVLVPRAPDMPNLELNACRTFTESDNEIDPLSKMIKIECIDDADDVEEQEEFIYCKNAPLPATTEANFITATVRAIETDSQEQIELQGNSPELNNVTESSADELLKFVKIEVIDIDDEDDAVVATLAVNHTDNGDTDCDTVKEEEFIYCDKNITPKATITSATNDACTNEARIQVRKNLTVIPLQMGVEEDIDLSTCHRYVYNDFKSTVWNVPRASSAPIVTEQSGDKMYSFKSDAFSISSQSEPMQPNAIEVQLEPLPQLQINDRQSARLEKSQPQPQQQQYQRSQSPNPNLQQRHDHSQSPHQQQQNRPLSLPSRQQPHALLLSLLNDQLQLLQEKPQQQHQQSEQQSSQLQLQRTEYQQISQQQQQNPQISQQQQLQESVHHQQPLQVNQQQHQTQQQQHQTQQQQHQTQQLLFKQQREHQLLLQQHRNQHKSLLAQHLQQHQALPQRMRESMTQLQQQYRRESLQDMSQLQPHQLHRLQPQQSSSIDLQQRQQSLTLPKQQREQQQQQQQLVHVQQQHPSSQQYHQTQPQPQPKLKPQIPKHQKRQPSSQKKQTKKQKSPLPPKKPKSLNQQMPSQVQYQPHSQQQLPISQPPQQYTMNQPPTKNYWDFQGSSAPIPLPPPPSICPSVCTDINCQLNTVRCYAPAESNAATIQQRTQSNCANFGNQHSQYPNWQHFPKPTTGTYQQPEHTQQQTCQKPSQQHTVEQQQPLQPQLEGQYQHLSTAVDMHYSVSTVSSSQNASHVLPSPSLPLLPLPPLPPPSLPKSPCSQFYTTSTTLQITPVLSGPPASTHDQQLYPARRTQYYPLTPSPRPLPYNVPVYQATALSNPHFPLSQNMLYTTMQQQPPPPQQYQQQLQQQQQQQFWESTPPPTPPLPLPPMRNWYRHTTNGFTPAHTPAAHP